jgi:hypothetical protein
LEEMNISECRLLRRKLIVNAGNARRIHYSSLLWTSSLSNSLLRLTCIKAFKRSMTRTSAYIQKVFARILVCTEIREHARDAWYMGKFKLINHGSWRFMGRRESSGYQNNWPAAHQSWCWVVRGSR